MKIYCSEGCICYCTQIDGKDVYDVDSSVRTDCLSRIKKYVNKYGMRAFDGYFYTFSRSTRCNVEFTENEDYEITHIEGVSVDDMSNVQQLEIFNRTIELNDTDECFSDAVNWFMKEYIGLKYQYTCEDCGDSVYSKQIKI